MLKTIFSEPLFHFLVIGAAIFAAFEILGEDEAHSAERLVVSAGKVENLAALFERTWQRPPTAGELDALVDEYVREEILYREGVAMGLDTDDTVIRRRVRQKMDFMIEDMMAVEDPGDAELARFLADNPERYRVPPVFDFRHVFLSPERRGDAATGDAADLLARLAANDGDFAELGDPIMLEPAYASIDGRSVARLFGEEFSERIAGLPTGSWQGPVRSGFGWHLVRVDRRIDARNPALDEVRDAVRRDWDVERRDNAREAFFDELLERYEVVVETPAADDGTSTAGSGD